MTRRPIFPPVFGSDRSRTMIDDFTLRAQRHVAHRDPPTNSLPVVPYEKKDGPWSGAVELGFEVPFSGDPNNDQMVLKVPEWGFPVNWTISLGLEHGDVENAGFDITALITFGAGGTTQKVEIDWLNGAAITLPMNAANVVARFNLADLETAPDVPSDLLLRATAARGTSSRSRPTRSYWFPNGTGTTPLRIPPFAKQLMIFNQDTLSTPDFYQDNQIAFMTGNDAGATAVARYHLTQFLTYFDAATPIFGAPVAVPIPPFARYILFETIAGEVTTSLDLGLQYLIGI